MYPKRHQRLIAGMYSWVDGQTTPIWAMLPMGHRAGWGEPMGSDIVARRQVTSITHRRCVQASRKEKAGILDEFVETNGHNRSYAARVLRNGVSEARSRSSAPQAPSGRRRGGRRRVYGDAVLEPMARIWEILGLPCGKRLAACLPGVVDALVVHGELVCRPKIIEQLRSVSATTIDWGNPTTPAGEEQRPERRLRVH